MDELSVSRMAYVKKYGVFCAVEAAILFVYTFIVGLMSVCVWSTPVIIILWIVATGAYVISCVGWTVITLLMVHKMRQGVKVEMKTWTLGVIVSKSATLAVVCIYAVGNMAAMTIHNNVAGTVCTLVLLLMLFAIMIAGMVSEGVGFVRCRIPRDDSFTAMLEEEEEEDDADDKLEPGGTVDL